jgi:CHAT domain-containing protein
VVDPSKDLYSAKLEAETLIRHYQMSEPLRGPNATRGAVLGRAESARQFLYTGHAEFVADRPLDSRISLADEPLTIRDLFLHRCFSQCELAVLNGCESGVMQPDAMDDYVSLPTAMLFSGARCVLSTLWPVRDLPAALASVHFHELWNGGRGLKPAAALRETQRWLRGESENPLQSGHDLLKFVLPKLLSHVTNEHVRKTCEAAAREFADRFPTSPPFASPVHWAAFTVTGLAW